MTAQSASCTSAVVAHLFQKKRDSAFNSFLKDLWILGIPALLWGILILHLSALDFK